MRLRLIVLAVLAALLAGCLLQPGKFDSALDLRRDGTFAFHYTGELVFLPLTDAARGQLAKGAAGKAAAPAGEQTEVFVEEACTSPGSNTPQPCSPDAIAAQRRAWESRRKTPAPDPGAAALTAMLGGINAADPNAAAALVETLRHQAGWRKVVYKGNGVFEVDFAQSGRLDHDFTFPTVEHGMMITPLVSVIRRADGSVRVEAPGFAPGMGALAALGAMQGGGAAAKSPLKGLPPMDGLFAVTTDGTIATNNTEEGPVADGTGQRLTWHVTNGRGAAPGALIRTN